MSKLGAYRIVNLTYNNNSQNAVNKIIDELFELKSEHSLMLLRNGGGKTVQIQMLMSPFVSPKYRNLGSRNFEDYFTDDRNPTYIVTEWELENNDRVMIGIAVKKTNSLLLDEDSNSLDIKAFVYEYQDANDEFGIRKMPFSKNTDKGYTVMSMNDAETLFKSLKNRNKFAFNHYDLSIPNHRSRYYEKLRGYSIEPTEWESIMRNINLAEGGLSELFKNCKTEGALIEDWMLKNIGIKLNREEDVVKEMGKSIKQYVNNKQSKQSLIDVIHGIEDYKVYSDNILEVNSKFKTSLGKLEKKKSEIEEIMIFNHQKYSTLTHEEEELESSMGELNRDIAFNKYEESSYNYHKALDGIKVSSEKLEDEENELENLKAQSLQLERDLDVQDVISLNSQKITKEKELDVVRAKIEKELKSNAEIEEQLINVAYSLNNILKDEQSQNAINLKSCVDKEAEINSTSSSVDLVLINLKADKKTLESEVNKFNNVTKVHFEKIENELKSKIELPLGYTNSDIECMKIGIESKIDEKQLSINSIKKDVDSLKAKISKLKDERSNNNLKEVKVSTMLDKLNVELQGYESQCENIREVLEYLGLDTDKVFDNEENLFRLRSMIDSVITKNDIDIDKRNKKMSELDMLKKGVVVEIPKDVKNKLSELEIDYELGLNYLSKLKISDSQKLELLERNPFLPFSIIVESDDIKLLEKTDLDIASSYNVYIANRDDINLRIESNKSNSVYNLNNLTMLLNFNKTLLSEETKEQVIKDIEADISSLNSVIAENRKYLNKLEKCKNVISDFKVTESMIETLKSSIGKEFKALEEINESIKEIENEIRDIEEKLIPDKNALLAKEEQLLSELNTELNLIVGFIAELSKYEEELEMISSQENKLVDISKEISNSESEKVFLEKQKVINEASYRNYRDIAKEIELKLNEISDLSLDLSNAVAIKEDTNKLEATFRALKVQSSTSLEELQEMQKSLVNEINRIDAEINSLVVSNKIKLEEYEDKTYLIEVKQELKKTLALKKREIDEQQKAVTKASLRLEKSNIEAQSILDKCKKAYKNLVKVLMGNGFSEVYPEPCLDREDIEFKDFKQKEDSLKEELLNIESRISEVRDNISYIKSSVQKLDFLSDIKSNISDINEREVVLYINEISEIEDFTAKAIKDFKELEKEINNNKQEIDEVFGVLTTEFKYRDIAPFSRNIQSLLEIKYDPNTVEKSIESTIEVLNKLQKQHEADLKVVHEERENISKTLLKYVEQVYTHMSMIDRNSRINIEGENKKMLEIRQPEWDVVLFTTKVEEFLENTVQMCETRIRHNEPIDEYIATQVTTSRLYDTVVGIKDVNIVLRKLEALNNQIGTSRVKWTDVVKNSGGEGFVSAFVILVSLLSYMRKDSETIGDKKEEGKVLIMDNPFGKMSSEHLIRPVMTIAEKYNTQLICYTAQKGDNIYNRFPNIYHMETEFIAGAKMNVLTATREGEFTETHLNGSRFVVGEQQTLDDFFNIE